MASKKHTELLRQRVRNLSITQGVEDKLRRQREAEATSSPEQPPTTAPEKPASVRITIHSETMRRVGEIFSVIGRSVGNDAGMQYHSENVQLVVEMMRHVPVDQWKAAYEAAIRKTPEPAIAANTASEKV